MSKISHKREYPIRRPKERERNLLLELQRQQREKEKKENVIKRIRDITLNTTQN